MAPAVEFSGYQTRIGLICKNKDWCRLNHTKCSSDILSCLIRFSLHLLLYQRRHSILRVYQFSISVKTTKLVLLRFHVLYLSTAALLMFTERLQFWDTPGLQSVYEICTVTIFFHSDQKNTKWKGIFHI